MRSLLRKILQFALLAAVFFYIGRFVHGNYSELKQYEFHIRTGRLLVSLLGFWLYLGGKLLNWQRITTEIGVRIPLDKAAVAWSYSMLGKYFPGKVFFLLGRLYFYGLEKQSRARVTFCFFLENVCSVMGAILILATSMLFVNIPALSPYRGWLLLFFLGVLIVLYPPVFQKLLDRIALWLKRPRMILGLKTPALLILVGRYYVTWLIFGVAFYYFVRAFVPVPGSLFLFLTGLYALAALIGIFSLFAPSGIGVREGVLLFGLKQVLPNAVSAVIAVSGRLWTTAGELLFIAGIAVFARFRGIRMIRMGDMMNREHEGPVPANDKDIDDDTAS